MMTRSTRVTVLLLLTLSLGLLLPGLFLPVLTIRGVLTRDGIAHVAPTCSNAAWAMKPLPC